MKKLALALMCLVSVAFFASCNPEVENPEPSIAVFVGSEGYLHDGAVVDVNVEYPFAFRAASNAETQKDLASFKIYIDDELQLDSVISGKEFQFSGTFSYEYRDIIDQTSIKAVVTDAAGKMNTATINLSINQPATQLETKEINWVKTGHNAQDLSAYGLFWKETNYKSPFTHILPAEGCTLYLVENGEEDFVNIATDIDLTNYFSNLVETSRPIEDYANVDCNQSADYHDLLISKDADGNLHAIIINHAEITTPTGLGTRITITGKAK